MQGLHFYLEKSPNILSEKCYSLHILTSYSIPNENHISEPNTAYFRSRLLSLGICVWAVPKLDVNNKKYK